MLLGEAPGAEEEASGVPFVGAAGRELDSALRAIGHTRDEVFITNTTRCRPPGNRTPLSGEVSACFPYLVEEISAVEPKVILCLGGSALKALTGKDGVAANRGRAVAPKPTVRIGDAQIFVTFHPAAVLHNRNSQEQARIREAIIQDLTLAFSLAHGSRAPQDHKRALLPEGYTAQELRRGLDGLKDCKVLACDLEWSALSDRGMSWPWTKGAELFSIAFSGRVGSTILSLAFSWPPPPEVEEELRAFFRSKPMVFHNALADLNWLEHVGLKCRLAGDTLVLAYLMDEEQRLALGQLAPLYTDVEPGWKIPPRERRPVFVEDWLELLGYNTNDTYATLKLAEALHARLESLPINEREGIKRIYYKLLLPLIPTFVRMALRGIPMDVEGVIKELRDSYDRSRSIAVEIANAVGCNSNQAAALAGSPMQTLDYLKNAYELDIDSSRKDDLAEYEKDYPIIKLIQAFRWEHNKVQGTYLGPWFSLLEEQQDGCLHSVYRITYARTGRTSAEIEKGGSLQLMPRNQPGRELKARHLVRARPGFQIIAADYSQIEMRVMAWFANDKAMLQLFREDADLHKATAAFVKSRIALDVFWPRRNEFMEAVTKEERQGAKGVNFGLIFGLQPAGLVDYSRMTYGVDMTLDEAVLAHEQYFKLFSDIAIYHDYCRREVFPRGYTETPFGRFRRHLEDPNKAINTPVQATASDMTLLALHNIDRVFEESEWPAYTIGFVHDSILCEVKDEFVVRAKEVIKNEMENLDLQLLGVSSIPVPLKADVLVGPTWGEASED